MPTLVQ